MKHTDSQTTKDAVRYIRGMDDWERRIAEAKRDLDDARWRRECAEVIEDLMRKNLRKLRRGYRAVKSSISKLTEPASD